MSVQVLQGDALETLRTLPDKSVQCCVCSPPYWDLRDYGMPGQLGLERTPEEYVAGMVGVFAEVRRVLRDDGTLWLNMGDTYAAQCGATEMPAETLAGGVSGRGDEIAKRGRGSRACPHRDAASLGLKHKDLIGVPWMLAFALRQDGWYLRSDIIWAKPNPMPESVTDRPTKSHEYIFLLSKSRRYFYNADAIATPATESSIARLSQPTLATQEGSDRVPGKTNGNMKNGVNARTVWTIATQPYKEAHFATFPPELARRCILAGSMIGDTILDPFGGAGTTGLVADRNQRDAILIELNPSYCEMARHRIRDDAPLFFTA